MAFGKYLAQALPGQLHGTLLTTLVTVSGGPSLLPATPMQGRKDFIVYNEADNDPVYVGGSGVLWTTGIPVEAGGSFGFQCGRAQVYATTSGGGDMDVRVLEIS